MGKSEKWGAFFCGNKSLVQVDAEIEHLQNEVIPSLKETLEKCKKKLAKLEKDMAEMTQQCVEPMQKQLMLNTLLLERMYHESDNKTFQSGSLYFTLVNRTYTLYSDLQEAKKILQDAKSTRETLEKQIGDDELILAVKEGCHSLLLQQRKELTQINAQEDYNVGSLQLERLNPFG